MITANVIRRSPAGSESGAGARRFRKARPLAANLGISPKTIFRWADAGRIHRFKLNPRLVLFDVDEINQLIEEARVGAPLATDGGEPGSTHLPDE
jgi:predicted DNA-binding transcriptional regulator AlpA